MSKSMKLYFDDVCEASAAMFVIDMEFENEFYIDESFDRTNIYVSGDEKKLEALIDCLDEHRVRYEGGRIS